MDCCTFKLHKTLTEKSRGEFFYSVDQQIKNQNCKYRDITSASGLKSRRLNLTRECVVNRELSEVEYYFIFALQSFQFIFQGSCTHAVFQVCWFRIVVVVATFDYAEPSIFVFLCVSVAKLWPKNLEILF